MSESEFDLVVFGATSFVGKLLTAYLAERDEPVRWAIAGRSLTKLEQVRSSLGAAGESLPIIVADAANEQDLRALCARTRVVVSTVGPYALYGEPLVKVCAETGTDYCDLTGETQWIRKMVDKYEAAAQQSGARIVHCCGFDSVPSDLGVSFLQKHAFAQWGAPATNVTMRVKTLKGGASGGTIASLINVVKEAASDPQLRKALVNPYYLTPTGHGFTARQHAVTGPEFDADFDEWIAPFVMAAINERVVHRSNALSHNTYGDAFTYNEAMLVGPGIKGRMTATGIVAGLGGFMIAAVVAPLRTLLERYVLPKPGEGPTPHAQASGRYDVRFVGHNRDRTIRAKVTGVGDPGYGSSSKILGQAALSLALNETDRDGGFWTPATIFDERFADRLTSHAGVRFELV
ncbi:saccharopine dehydrogenase family protein [Antrihabitans stalactiti]|uniref:Saccharopine dehydrogenase n=1 Tax=Antrihabitans stalactiti TaxID=2584121 RepID=A0A848KR02_9NOCA|nr:saccharopine dehydrogenase NADP-binding domain-containing protein [Antrihabitans stalactiti]NMN99012.1 saccharopine dehydrogenase [Antrihabitans stalactiti]